MRLSTQRKNKQAVMGTVGLDSAEVSAILSTNTISAFDTLDSLPIANLTLGDRGFVESSGTGARLYISDGSGWYNASLVNINTTVDSIAGYSLKNHFNVGESANYTVIATDSDNSISSYGYQLFPTGAADSAVTITQDSSEFNIKIQDSATIANFSISFTATDGVSTGTLTKNFTIEQFTPIQRMITPYHVHAVSGGMAQALPVFEFREDDDANYTSANMTHLAGNITTAVEGAGSYTHTAATVPYGTMYITCWDSNSCTYAAGIRRNNAAPGFPEVAYLYDPDSQGASGGGIWGGRTTNVAAGTASDTFPSDTHYHRRDTENFTDTSLATLTFGFREYGLFGTSTVFNDGSGNTTYYHNTGTAGVSGGTTTGSCQPFHEVRLYAETADTTNLIWSAPLKY